jgi:N-acetyl-alpha-D-glucosaminyl L-malate synthase BshA
MNIAVLLHGGAGGSGVVATELGLAFAHQGHDVHFVAGRLPFRLGELSLSLATVFYHQVESMSYPLFDAPLTTLAEASKLTEVIEEYDVDVIHAHYAIPHATAAILARDMCRRRPRPAVVTTLHGTDVTLVGLEPAYLRTTQYAIERSDAVTAVSRHLADYTHAEMGIRRDITVIPNAVDHRRFKPGGSGELRLRYAHPDEKLLVHVSNFRPVKRVLDVIRIFAEVSESIGSRLLMIGDGPDRPRAVELAHELGVSGRVSFLGSFLRIEDVLAISDLFLLPSAKESFGLAALEAMSSGVPVVASRAGGIPEVVVDGVTGYLCEMGDVRGMAEAAIRLLSDPERQQAFAEAARAHAVAEFCEGKVVPLYAGAYGRALSGRRTERQVGTGV